jgi:hypothetical protein
MYRLSFLSSEKTSALGSSVNTACVRPYYQGRPRSGSTYWRYNQRCLYQVDLRYLFLTVVALFAIALDNSSI